MLLVGIVRLVDVFRLRSQQNPTRSPIRELLLATNRSSVCSFVLTGSAGNDFDGRGRSREGWSWLRFQLVLLEMMVLDALVAWGMRKIVVWVLRRQMKEDEQRLVGSSLLCFAFVYLPLLPASVFSLLL